MGVAAKHTAGPWLVSETFAVGPAGEIVACTPHNHSRKEANARLIAAAPELLEALQGLVRFTDAVRVQVGMGKTQLERLAKARAAIAKAEGGAA